MSLATLLFFTAAVIGFTHIIVDPATIVQPFRAWVANKGNPFFVWLNKLLSCYQCCGTWVGFICGAILFTDGNWFQYVLTIFLSGMAGSFIATWAATYLNFLEARSIISIGDDDDDDTEE